MNNGQRFEFKSQFLINHDVAGSIPAAGAPPYKCTRGGIGRRKGLKILGRKP